MLALAGTGAWCRSSGAPSGALPTQPAPKGCSALRGGCRTCVMVSGVRAGDNVAYDLLMEDTRFGTE